MAVVLIAGLAAALLFGSTEAENREYFVRAELVLWDFGPTGTDLMTGVPFDEHEDADVFLVNRPEEGQIGRQYWKCIYEEYTDGSFTVKKPRPPWAGLIGPTLRCEVGDRMAISFQNNCTKALTMHPHGVKYNKAFEGAPYNDGRDGRGDHVEPGETYTYLWTCDEHSGPGPADGSSVAWLYHSHNPSRVDSNTGLIGPIVITRRGEADKYAKPLDVDLEYVLYLSVIDENKNYLLDRNIDEFIVQQGHSLTEEEREELKADGHFEEGNLMHGINGRLYGNLDGFTMQPGQRVRWYVFSLGTEADVHVMHWKGHSVLYRGQRTTGIQLMAGVSSVADMIPAQVGQWGMYCHTNDHIVGGMIAAYDVVGVSLPAVTSGRTREYFIQAEELVWDYGPTNETLYGTPLDEDEHAEVFFKNDPAKGRIGGKYLKCLYREYTDATFATRKLPAAEWRHLGMLGPVIRGVVGDSIKVVYSNKCTKLTSINVPALLKPKGHEGWHYGDAVGADPSSSGVVAPGGQHTYEWQVVDGPGPLDLSSMGFVYNSHQPMSTDTNSGLVGLLIITGFGQADDTGKPLDVKHEMVSLLTVTDEGSSYLLDANIQKFILDRGGAQTAAEIEELKEDDDFLESNLMHGINGRLFGNSEAPQLVAGEKTRLYSMAVGTEVDLHSLVLTGHSFLIRGERRAQLNLMPNDVQEADFLPTAGTWAVYCQTNDHLVGGMIAQVAVATNPVEDPMVVRWQDSGKKRRYYIQAEELIWDYGVTGHDQTGQYFSIHGHASPVAWEDGDGAVFMANDPEHGLIGRQYRKCLYRGYDSTFTVPEDRSPGSAWEHLAVLGPIMHAEVGDTIVVELRNNCSIPVSMHPQIAGVLKEYEGFEYKDADGQLRENPSAAVQPGSSFTYVWHVQDGPGPRDGSSIGTVYYSMAHGMVVDTYSGLKGPLVITRKGFADADGKPKDVETELVLMFEVTNEGESYLLNHNVAEFVTGRGGNESTDDEEFEESNLMHGINGQLYANLRGLTAKAETKVRWYVLSLGTEVDLHSVHWHGHTVAFGGHRLDVVMNMPATGITADMYVDNVGSWLMHCHINDHIEGGMIAVYTVTENPDRGEAQISTCQQMYGRSADTRREAFNFSAAHFEEYQFNVMLSPYVRVAYSVNYLEQYFDMMMAARTTGWIGLGFFGSDEGKDHAMINTDMVMGRVKQGIVYIDDSFAMGLETPKLDTRLGAADQLQMKAGFEENGVTYLRFRRSFKPQHLDEYDYAFRSDLEQVQVVYAYSSINTDNLVYHGPTRGYAKIPWNMNCSSNLFFNLRTSECEGCDRGYYRLAWDERFSASRCERCPEGTIADLPGELRSSELCEECGILHGTSLYPGAASYEDCVCELGYYHPCEAGDCRTDAYTKAGMRAQASSFCLACPPGMECLGGLEAVDEDSLERRHQQPLVPEGFYSPPGILSVYKCYDDPKRCPGGLPGQCAEGREGIQCAKCKPGWTAAEDGKCRPCGGGDLFPLVFGCIFIVLLLCLIYRTTVSDDKMKKSHSMLLVTISGSQLLTVLQMLGAISVMGVFWPGTLASAYSAVRVVNFNVEVLKLECVVRPAAIGVLLFKVFLVITFLCILSIIHVAHVLVKHRGRFRQRLPAYISSLGTVLMAFFISITSTVFSPLQCSARHPNGLSTLRDFPSVVCWEEGEHISMVVVAFVAAVIPTSCLCIAIWVVSVLPQKLSQGDTAFLSSWAFLLFRFRSGAYWYALAFLGRSTAISLVPAIPEVLLQIAAMLLVLIASLCLVNSFKPWRVRQANTLDTIILSGTIVVVSLSGLFIEDVNKELVAGLCCVMLILVVAFIPVAVGYGFYQRIAHAKIAKPYSLFICHHKAATGAFARLLKMLCSGRQDFRGKILIDSDGPSDLDKLYDLVGNQSNTLVALCSGVLLARPVCVGELATAKERNVNVVKVIFPDFKEPDADFIEQYATYVPDLTTLAQRGVGLMSVQGALRWFLDRPKLQLPARISMAVMQELSTKLVAGPTSSAALAQADDAPGVGSAGSVVLPDHANWEAVMTAHMLVHLLSKSSVQSATKAPSVLAPSIDLTESTETLIVVCTNGAFCRPHVLRTVALAAKWGMSCLPVIAVDGFRFPKGNFMAENQVLLASITKTPAQLAAIVGDIFKQSAVTFDASCSEELLSKKAAEVAERVGHSARLLKVEDVDLSAPSEANASQVSSMHGQSMMVKV